MTGRPYRWFGRDRPADGWEACPAARPAAWGLPDHRPADPPVAGPFPSAGALWAALGAADEACGPEARSLAIALPVLDATRRELEAALDRSVTVEAFVRLWATDLEVAARTAPGQPQAPSERPVTGEVLALAATPTEAALAALAEVLEGVPPLADGVPALPAAGAAAGRVATGEGEHVVVRLRVPGGNWLPVPAPYAYYGGLGPPLGGRPDPERPAFPAALAERLLRSEAPTEQAVPRTLAALPATPSTWRTQFWITLLERAPPAELARVMARNDEGVTLLARALHRTPAWGPVLAAAGEQRLLDPERAFLPADAAAWATRAPDALPPARRAVALALQARGLVEPWSARLFCEARDRWTGALDPRHPTARALLVDPLREALLAGAPEPGRIVALLRAAEGAGGPELVGDLLDGMLAEGATAPGELGALARRLPAGEAGWLGRAAAGSLAGTWLAATR